MLHAEEGGGLAHLQHVTRRYHERNRARSVPAGTELALRV